MSLNGRKNKLVASSLRTVHIFLYIFLTCMFLKLHLISLFLNRQDLLFSDLHQNDLLYLWDFWSLSRHMCVCLFKISKRHSQAPWTCRVLFHSLWEVVGHYSTLLIFLSSFTFLDCRYDRLHFLSLFNSSQIFWQPGNEKLPDYFL